MINTQLKFEGKIPTVEKLLHSHKMLKFQGQFDLEGQDQVHQFSNAFDTFRCLINCSSWKVKFVVVYCLIVKIKILDVWRPI